VMWCNRGSCRDWAGVARRWTGSRTSDLENCCKL